MILPTALPTATLSNTWLGAAGRSRNLIEETTTWT